jgi:hypothetical protein
LRGPRCVPVSRGGVPVPRWSAGACQGRAGSERQVHCPAGPMPFWFLCSTLCFSGLPSSTFLPRAALAPRSSPMAPPRDTAGSAGHQQPQQPAAAPGRFNQKSTFRNGTTEEGWFYPTPAALKSGADVRGAARRGNSSVYEGGIGSDVPAQATRKPITRTSSSIRTTRTAWCTASDEACGRPFLRWGLTCVCDPKGSREGSSEECGGLRAGST